MSKIVIRILWALLGATIVTSVFAYWAINNGWIGYMPPIEELQNPINRYATQIYSSDGKIMSGIDFYALGRAIVKRGLLRQKSAGGGSTITQQLAKQLYSGTAHSVMERLLQKPIEWVIAVQLERNYTKDEIITMYLNYFDFLHNAVGIKTAANTYFGKDPRDLTVNEAATLVGLCKNPSYYNPVRYRERSQERRNVVLSQMVKAGFLSETDYQKYSIEPIKLNFHVSDHKDGVAVYFRDFLRRYMMAKKPERKDYPSWNMVRFHQDSINWETDPLYGWCNKNRKRNGDTYNVYTDGLKVYTTIDSRMQEYAEQAAREHIVKYLQPAFDKENRGRKSAPYSGKLSAEQVNKILMRSVRQCERYRVLKESGASDEEIKKSFNTKTEMSVFTYHGEKDTIMTPLDSIRYYKSFLRCGFMSMCPQNGHVKAYVGGLDFMHFAYDMCMEGRRQVGSTIKPFLYSLAMENGFSPCDLAPNVQETYIVGGRAWTPRNGSRARYGEMVTLKWGLQQSNNWISAYLMSKLNPQAFVTLLREYGINNPEIHPSMALCLGPCDITVGEMVSAYTTFVNHGIRTSPLFVTRIADNEGNTIVEFQPRMNEVISEESAHKMLYMLKGVVEGGTAGRLRYKYNIPGDIAGKTGTTNNNSDAWFMGITPTLVSGCWVGGEDRDIHFTMTSMGQGAAGALPVWAYYMKRVYNDKRLGYNSEAVFDLPAGYNPCQYDESGLEDVPEEDVGEIFE